MVRSDIAGIINAIIEERLELPMISNDVFRTAEGAAICCRHDPAPAAEQRYSDGSRLVQWNLSYYIRNENMKAARDTAYDITKTLDGMDIESDVAAITTEASTLPQYIDTDDKGAAIYSASITAKYIEE